MPPPLSNPAAAGDPITYPMWISNLTNSNSAMSCLGHGPYAIKIISNGNFTSTYFPGPNDSVTIDLLESEWGMDDGTNHDQMTATANWDACPRAPCAIRIVAGDVNAMEYQELVYGTDIPGNPLGSTPSPCTHIVSVVRNAKGLEPYDGAIAEIMVDQPLVKAHNGSGGDVTINVTSNPGTVANCYNATIRTPLSLISIRAATASYATTSSTEIARSSTPEHARSRGSPPLEACRRNSPRATPTFTPQDIWTTDGRSGYYYCVHLCPPLRLCRAGCKLDAHDRSRRRRNQELDDLGEEFHVVNGTPNSPTVQGGKGGQTGLGIVNNFYTVGANPPSSIPTKAPSAPGRICR